MTSSHQPTGFGAWARRVPEVLKSMSSFLFPTRDPSASPSEQAAYIKKHRKKLAALGLIVADEHFLVREERSLAEKDLRLQLFAEARSAAPIDILKAPDLQKTEAAQAWLEQLRKDLGSKTEALLNQAVAALRALSEQLNQPEQQKWLGKPELLRKKYLEFPERLAANEALTLARTRHKEVLTLLSRGKSDELQARLKTLDLARLTGRNLHRRYVHNLPFLSSNLELAFDIEKTLEHKELDALLAASDVELEALIDKFLKDSRLALVSRVEAQLRDLARRIKTLPHIELLDDTVIATTVAPYYGGLNRAFKKRRAKSALVAVEESAREAKYQDDVIKLNEQRSAYADIAAYYPTARALKRQLVLYVGPTNSGKTWRSLNDLAAGESGCYLAPLRLLALEGQEELEKRGKATSFITGEERDLRPGANFISSTIEMLDVERVVDGVVIDEVQLLADERRGWAWLAALLGAPARKVIMTGSPDCVELVKDLAAYLGEELTINECQRYNELRVADAPMRLKDVRAGTAVVCFSRRDVLRIKNQIEEHTSFKVAVVYGNLSPQVRREEARRFRSGEAEILVATDAIAMGLNLPIAEVLFYTIEKFNGEEMVELSPSDIRQIGGRAGRHGFAQFGTVNALDQKSLNAIKKAVQGHSEMLKPPCYVAPGHNHIQIISSVLGTDSLERILTFFERAIEFSDERFARSNIDDLSYLSSFVDERLPFLDVKERLTIASAPVGIRNETVVGWFLDRMLPAFRNPHHPDEEPEELDELFAAAERFSHEAAQHQLELRDAEDYLKTLTVYAWLAYRYPDIFTRIEECEERRESVNAFVERSLRGMMGRRCTSCGVALPKDFGFPICNACHAAKGGGSGSRRGRRSGSRRGRDSSERESHAQGRGRSGELSGERSGSESGGRGGRGGRGRGGRGRGSGRDRGPGQGPKES